jgi:hypothetical protein
MYQIVDSKQEEPLYRTYQVCQANISHSISFIMASRSKCRHVPTDQLEKVVNEICADEECGDEIMIPKLDEFDSDNTVIDSDSQNSNHEHLMTRCAVPDKPTSWTNRDIVPTIYW